MNDFKGLSEDGIAEKLATDSKYANLCYNTFITNISSLNSDRGKFLFFEIHI